MTQTAPLTQYIALPYLAAWRAKRLLSQRELGLAAGVTRHTITFLENKRYRARYFTVRALAQALRITPHQLITVDPNNEKCRCGRYFSDCDYPDCR